MTRQVSIAIFGLAAMCEITGAFLVWQWVRLHKPWWYGLGGFLLLMLYGLLPTAQPAAFGRVYAAYGGFFIVLALLWGWRFDGTIPDRYDWLGLALCVVGTAVIMYAPRR